MQAGAGPAGGGAEQGELPLAKKAKMKPATELAVEEMEGEAQVRKLRGQVVLSY